MSSKKVHTLKTKKLMKKKKKKKTRVKKKAPYIQEDGFLQRMHEDYIKTESLCVRCFGLYQRFIKACMYEPQACRRRMLAQIRGELMAVVSRTVSSMLYHKINHLDLCEEARHGGLNVSS
ncbi:uncharacterized protein V6R79_009327 [Siganus canaliculatus]